jgi:hypothetical protein
VGYSSTLSKAPRYFLKVWINVSWKACGMKVFAFMLWLFSFKLYFNSNDLTGFIKIHFLNEYSDMIMIFKNVSKNTGFVSKEIRA